MPNTQTRTAKMPTQKDAITRLRNRQIGFATLFGIFVVSSAYHFVVMLQLLSKSSTGEPIVFALACGSMAACGMCALVCFCMSVRRAIALNSMLRPARASKA